MVVNDLRSALEVLRQMDGQLVETDIEVDPEAELQGCTGMWEQAVRSCVRRKLTDRL